MTKYKIRWDSGEEDDEAFDGYEEADGMAQYYQACSEEGAETLCMNNPGDDPYSEDEYEQPEYEIIEADE